jgi:hypothetical protein
MDANSFLKRVTLIALASALPTFVSVASPAGGGHSSGGSSGGSSSGGSSGGHSSGGSSGGHSASSSNGGHSSSASNSGHSSSASNSGHSSSASNSGHSSSASNSGHSSTGSKGGHSSSASNSGHSSTSSKGGHPTGDPSTDLASVAGGHSVSGTHINSVHKVSVSVPNTRNFSSGGSSGRSNWEGDDERRLHHRRLLFGFLPY